MGRFDDLKPDSNSNSKNPFKKENTNSRFKKNEDKNEEKNNFKKPGKFSKDNNGKNRFQKSEIKEKKTIFETEVKFKEKEGDFPDLNPNNNNSYNKNNNNNLIKYSSILTNQEESEKKEIIKTVPNGWVKIYKDKNNGKIIKEYGVKNSIEKQNIYQDLKERYIEDLNKRIIRYKEEDEIRYPYDKYLYSWEIEDYIEHQLWLKKLDELDGIDQFNDLESNSESEFSEDD